MGNIYNFCEVGLKVSGVSPIHASAALAYRNVSLSSVQSALTAHHTLLFMGTTTGTLKKVRIGCGDVLLAFSRLYAETPYSLTKTIFSSPQRRLAGFSRQFLLMIN
ncbi:Plexin-B [Portunus trituberculatus]|uniref:Plexin-B n=1 Tax=Portunus trituberculatus TaxID=210409 RepID=A0A5B7JLJ9_PORTR|nr:Plexin-B [Portunus trituberculatus]